MEQLRRTKSLSGQLVCYRECFFRCLHALASSSSSLPWLPSNHKKDRRACWRKPPPGHCVGCLSWKILKDKATLASETMSHHEMMLCVKTGHGASGCVSIITRINSFVNSNLASKLPRGSAVLYQFSRSII